MAATNNEAFSSLGTPTGSLTDITDGTDAVHTGIVKALNRMATGSVALDGFNVTGISATTITFGNGNILRDGSLSAITGTTVTIGVSDRVANAYHLIVVAGSTLAYRVGQANIVANPNDDDVIIGMVKWIDGSTDMEFQYLTGQKSSNSLSIARDNSGYTEEGTIKAATGGGILITGTSDVTLDGANDRVYVKDATDDTLKTVTVSSITSLTDLSTKEDLISGQTLSDLTTSVATGDELLVRDVDDSNNLKVVNASDFLSTLGYRDTDAVSAVEAVADLNLTGNLTIADKKLIVDTTTLVVNAPSYTDKVGIGTATPAVELEVNGDIKADRLEYDSTKEGFDTITADPVTTTATLSDTYGIYRVSSAPTFPMALTLPSVSGSPNYEGTIFRIDCVDTYSPPNQVSLTVTSPNTLYDVALNPITTPVDLVEGRSYHVLGLPDGWILTTVNADVVDDTTPQLGGDLDTNSNDITGDFALTGAVQMKKAVISTGNVSPAASAADSGKYFYRASSETSNFTLPAYTNVGEQYVLMNNSGSSITIAKDSGDTLIGSTSVPHESAVTILAVAANTFFVVG